MNEITTVVTETTDFLSPGNREAHLLWLKLEAARKQNAYAERRRAYTDVVMVELAERRGYELTWQRVMCNA